ncbi:hypothetical protein BDZ97DRAFT_1922452 [Flammula alnicola]|nr:hypothetical protein BDZ97DRAFT_1922452 [Flammula alnicola]
MSSPSPAPTMSFDSTIGAYEGGVMTSLFLYGITTVQAYSYFRNFPSDPIRMKVFVAGIWIFEAVHSGIVAHSLYWITVDSFGQEFAINNPLIKIYVASIFSALTTAAIQIFFAYRVHLLAGPKSYPTVVLCVLLTATSLLGQITLAITGYFAESVFDWMARWRVLLLVSYGTATVADVLIAANLCVAFWRRRAEAVHGQVHRLVDRVIAWSLETCLLTSIGMIIMMVLFVKMENFGWFSVFFMISRLFSNSLLASLNGRKTLRNELASQMTFVKVQTSQTIGSSRIRTEVRFVFERENTGTDIEDGLMESMTSETVRIIFYLSVIQAHANWLGFDF